MIGFEITTRSKLPAASATSSLLRIPQLTAVAAVAVAVILAAVSVATTLVNADSLSRSRSAPDAVVSANRSGVLSAEARDAFISHLSGETPSSVWVECDARDAVARDLAQDLGAAFEEAHWRVRILRPATFPLRSGVYLMIAEKASRTTEAVSMALVKAGVHHTEAEDYRAYGERRQREDPNWQGPTFAQDQEFVLVVGNPDPRRTTPMPGSP
jgi:hypothetical protein